MKNRRMETILLIGMLLILGIVALTLGSWIILNRESEPETYEQHIQLATQYAQNGKVDEAVRVYWDAIELDEENEEAYLKLGELYEEQEESELALQVYQAGYQKTGSENLQNQIHTLEASLLNGVESSSIVALNQSFVEKAAISSYQSLVKAYGTPEFEPAGADYLVARFPNLSANFYFRNSTTGSGVMNEAIPVEIELLDLKLLFSGMQESITYEELESMNLDGLSMEQDSTVQKLVVRFVGNNFEAKIEADENGTIASDAWNRIYPLSTSSAEEETAGTAYLSGTVVNAVNGAGVPDAEITIYSSEDYTTPIEHTVTDADGSYSVQGLDPGLYTASVSCSGYIDVNSDVTAADSGTTGQNITLSPELGEGEIRIVLEWGSEPYDLDSHLTGQTSDGENVHIYFSDKSSRDGHSVSLDYDDVDGYGPETTTIVDTAGSYTFWVVDYGRTGTMAASGATVRVYQGDAMIQEYTVPADAVNGWNVCSIEKGEVTSNNYACDPSQVG